MKLASVKGVAVGVAVVLVALALTPFIRGLGSNKGLLR